MAAGMDLPETMLLAEAVLIGLDNVTDGLLVYPNRIRIRFLEELPFMVTEAVSIPGFPRAFFSTVEGIYPIAPLLINP
jgi:adenylosuccinate lyase